MISAFSLYAGVKVNTKLAQCDVVAGLWQVGEEGCCDRTAAYYNGIPTLEMFVS